MQFLNVNTYFHLPITTYPLPLIRKKSKHIYRVCPFIFALISSYTILFLTFD